MTKNTFIVGFMLFAIFFGAGNLIFPPKLGLDSGIDFLPSIIGFVLTGVGLPLLGIAVSGYYQGGYKEALSKNVHPYFSLLFLMAIYLTIGPFFAIPRTGATAYQMAVVPFIGESSTLSLLIFTLAYYLIAVWFSLNPSTVVDRIGAILTPVLLVAILALVVKAVILLGGNELPAVATKADPETPLFTGIVEGYLTMDALASITFSVIVISAIKAKGIGGKDLIKQTSMAGIIAAIALAAIYISLAWIGNHYPISAETLAELNTKGQNIGTFILNSVATDTFGEFGRTLLGVIVTLACLTTSIGLIVTTSEYFNEVFPKISYKIYVLIFSLISFAIANQGLDFVISKSVPVLLVLYPIAMTVIFLMFINIFIRLPLMAQRLPLALVTIVSILSVAGVEMMNSLPMKDISMEWIPFAIAGTVIGYLVGKKPN
ncbi:branched-chain amino acid transport system II carrier protein [Mannheimia varigena]|uniref:Branched-chain amino acid transport system carrier protein n=1 Tax=Mannheimia varigena USDA-ARS-USMARC-1296 TaxID=1433287 RepID=W0QEU6_9PAST|nr:branched-chain amino acid transport system II carrier protein [Mannheimia varigena]AHG76420.1 Branched-chain amino acid carrier protein [Mannheimia varigena USDA-ARS-USMARC-1296]QLB17040.1 branched-chain amino acid transport system II carrier protein [Mannheimia varigena]TLU75428.1 branched-chain amino acid transport system II carrier protein [Mannheimia varigena]